MADEAAVVEEDISPAQSPLVTLSFQRNDTRKQKYLEAEPKALGITQMGLSLYNIICASVFLAKGITHLEHQIPFFVSSLLVVIAGSVAVVALNLHLPTLKACLGMQIVACGASIVNMVCALIKMEVETYSCWRNYHPYNDTFNGDDLCYEVRKVHLQFYAESALVQVALFAISVTLAVYCCKVVNCCAPAPKMPVITVQASPTQQ
ncbi:uncharacterized protein LOC114844764 isoform X3 [Betta splendens]|uniref:Uncharacterized protein LOC114844764 isoform X3 n=1 Tax=Betta splendens TaxID=158456 RepID=A0A6P7L4W5_BETSP|nr:uncharacterized protein LOC114844764 isoform X3 [Betta splendens]